MPVGSIAQVTPGSSGTEGRPESSEEIRERQQANQRNRRLSPRVVLFAGLALLALICAYRADDLATATVGFGDSLEKLLPARAASQPKLQMPPTEARGPSESPNAALLFNGFLAFIVIIAIVSLVFYFLPTFIAFRRGHPNAAPIAVINILLGWTAVGYAVALAWSLTHFDRQIAVTVNYPPPSPGPPPSAN
jgi:hypothetical protein